MRFKILSVVFVFVLIFIISAVGEDSLNPANDMKITGKGFKRIMKEGKYGEKDLKDIFGKRNEKLKKYFEKGKFYAIGQYFGEKGFIWTEEGESFKGVDEISSYFKSLKAETITFKTTLVVIHEIEKEFTKPKAEWKNDDVVDIILEHIDFSFNSPGGGSGVALGGHIRECFKP